MNIVLDASAFIGIMDGRILGSISGDLHAPDFIDVEVVSALRKRVRRGERTATAAREDLEFLRQLDLSRHASFRHSIRAWNLRDNVTAFDAVYVALAEAMGATLVTLDRRLARAAEPYCDVIVPETAAD